MSSNEYKKKDPEKWRNYHRDYQKRYRANMEATNPEKAEAMRRANRVSQAKYGKKGYAILREQLLSLLGRACIRCGYDTDERALQIDHVNGGGNEERRAYTSLSTYYRHIRDVGGVGYQILCANCNVIKRFEDREGG